MKAREANIRDLKQIIPIMKQVQDLHVEMRPDIFISKGTKEIKEQAINVVKGVERTMLVAENDNLEIVGILIYKIKEIDSGTNLKRAKVLNVSELCVEEKQRGKGIGKLLMQEVEKRKDKLGCSRLELNCWSFNENALKFYEAIGMKAQRIFYEK